VGFKPARKSGSHVILVKIDLSGKHAIVVPDHKEIDKGTLVEIIRQAGLKRDEFLKLVK
jgi:predicted RNA binding protein YcfA (HicA-like mRNA interferase family)